MNGEIKKYGILDVWGTLLGFMAGIMLVVISFVFMYGDNPLQFAYYANPLYSVFRIILDSVPYDNAVSLAIPLLLAQFVTTPIVFALYGWGIHAFLRKLMAQ